jgi:hypothetical protein
MAVTEVVVTEAEMAAGLLLEMVELLVAMVVLVVATVAVVGRVEKELVVYLL